MKTKLFSFTHKHKLEVIVLGVILLVGFLLRIQGVITETFAFTYDVGRDMAAAREIATGQNFPFIGPTSGLPGLFYGPWWYYFLTIPYIISGGSPGGAVVFIALTGVLTALLGYILGRKLAGPGLGLFVATFISISPVMIALGAQIWNPNIAPVFLILILLTLYFLFDFKNSQKKTTNSFFSLKFEYRTLLLWGLIGLLLGFSLDSEVVYGVLLIFGVSVAVLVLLFKRLTLVSIFAIGIGFLITLLPRLLFEVKNNFLMTGSIITYFTEQTPKDAVGHLSAGELFMNRIDVLFALWRETLAVNNTILGVILLVFCIGVYVIYYRKLDKKIRTFVLLLAIIILGFFVGLNFLKEEAWSHYIVGVPIVFILLFGISVYIFFENNKKYAVPIIGVVFLLLLLNLQPLKMYQDIQNPWKGDASVYKNQKAVVDYVYDQAAGAQFNYILYTPPIHDHTYSYLFSWYGEKKYGYQPSTESEELFFLIMEPDQQYPDRLTDWLEVRENDGKPVSEELLPGGVIVQTRQR